MYRVTKVHASYLLDNKTLVGNDDKLSSFQIFYSILIPRVTGQLTQLVTFPYHMKLQYSVSGMKLPQHPVC